MQGEKWAKNCSKPACYEEAFRGSEQLKDGSHHSAPENPAGCPKGRAS